MRSEEKTVKAVYDLMSIWHKAGFDATQYVGTMLYVMCLKKMIDENACKNPEHMGTILDITKIIFRPTSFEDIETLRRGARVLEETYSLDNGLLHEVLSTSRYQEDQWKKTFLGVVAAISEMENYGDVAQYLLYKISNERGNERVSSYTVAELLKIAANVKDGESVLDGTVGYGYSAVECIKGKDVSFCGVDIRLEAIQNTAMYLILSDVDNFTLMTEDFTGINTAGFHDKVIMDIPFGLKVNGLIGYQTVRARNWMDDNACKEMECLFLAEGLESLNDKGRMVVIVPQGFLFKQSKALSVFRENAVKRGMLKAVVSLPSVYNYTTINTTMLVFEQGNQDVLFVDASKLIQRERRMEPTFTDENKQLLQDILENKQVVNDISFRVSNDEVLAIGDWSIARFKKEENETTFRSLEEINGDLVACYDRLAELNDSNSKLSLFQ